MTYIEQLTKVREEALAYIRQVLEFRGTEYQLCDPDWYEEGIADELYQLPRGFTVGKKMAWYNELPLVMANIDNDGKITFTGIGLINEDGEDHEFELDELHTDVICAVADLVKSLEG